MNICQTVYDHMNHKFVLSVVITKFNSRFSMSFYNISLFFTPFYIRDTSYNEVRNCDRKLFHPYFGWGEKLEQWLRFLLSFYHMKSLELFSIGVHKKYQSQNSVQIVQLCIKIRDQVFGKFIERNPVSSHHDLSTV